MEITTSDERLNASTRIAFYGPQRIATNSAWDGIETIKTRG
ncbi:hypothetical protein Z949_649 [Sulfitobacter guttiformis KCTC 32187]|nr:hypothetical protein Z949_649 [Sulfitobacter guttiformis KCTC 32187]